MKESPPDYWTPEERESQARLRYLAKREGLFSLITRRVCEIPDCGTPFYFCGPKKNCCARCAKIAAGIRQQVRRAEAKASREARYCAVCGDPIPPTARADAKYCGKTACPQKAYRLRKAQIGN